LLPTAVVAVAVTVYNEIAAAAADAGTSNVNATVAGATAVADVMMGDDSLPRVGTNACCVCVCACVKLHIDREICVRRMQKTQEQMKVTRALVLPTGDNGDAAPHILSP
jgi:hypothetical protein